MIIVERIICAWYWLVGWKSAEHPPEKSGRYLVQYADGDLAVLTFIRGASSKVVGSSFGEIKMWRPIRGPLTGPTEKLKRSQLSKRVVQQPTMSVWQC